MKNELHYSPTSLIVRTGWMALAAAVVIIDFVAHAHGGLPSVFGLSFVPSATLIATALYLVGVTMVLTLGLTRHGGVALAATETGLTIHTAWFSKALPWTGLSRIALEVRYTKAGHYTVVAIHKTSGIARCHTIDARLLAEKLNLVSAWIDEAERDRVTCGGAPYVARTSGLAGYNARHAMIDVAADVAAARSEGAGQMFKGSLL